MANQFLVLTLLSLCIVLGTLGVSFNNAYIQNVKSGECITIGKDKNYDPLGAEKCDCGPYQFWKMEDGEHVQNELALHPYMDELRGLKPSGSTVGIWDKTATAWQKWIIHEEKDGSYSFVVKHTQKCLHQGGGGKIDQTDCDDNDASMKWKIVENPCGKLETVPRGRFQLRNPATGLCGVVMGKKDTWFAKIGSEKCSCSNDYHYWTISERVLGKYLISEGKSKQCFANWTPSHPGVTQCICDERAIHHFRLAPNEDGTFSIITQIDGKCVFLEGHSENTQMDFGRCKRDSPEQKWQFYDECEPEKYIVQPPKDVIPASLNGFFQNGQMNWLTVTGYTLLVGGRWDSASSTWYTVDGRQIQPGTDMWSVYFGNATPSFLNLLFQNNNTWNSVFGWMTPNFFKTWAPPAPPQPQNVIPNYLTTFFTNGQMNWLNPTRYALLTGGRWDSPSSSWYTVDGRQIQPGTEMWSVYFGDVNPSFLNVLFQNDKTWSGVFGWLTPNFFSTWTPWQQNNVIIPYYYEVPGK